MPAIRKPPQTLHPTGLTAIRNAGSAQMAVDLSAWLRRLWSRSPPRVNTSACTNQMARRLRAGNVSLLLEDRTGSEP